MLCAMATGAIILLLVMDAALEALGFLQRLGEKFAVDSTLFSTMVKITGVAYIAEFAVQACKDAGEGGTASKIELGAKILILGLCIPIVAQILELLTDVLQMGGSP